MSNAPDATILIAEDDSEIAEVMIGLLEGSNYKVLHAHQGQEALEILETAKPDLIISDIHMPKMNGFDFYVNMRKKENLHHVPFIFLTGFSDVESVVKGRELGVDDYLIKPVDARLLLSSIRGKLKRAEELRVSEEDQLADLKNHIVQVLTHEFRTPLTLINSTTDLLADVSMKFEPDEMQQFLSMIKEGGSRLQTLVESFLLASAIEAGEAQKEYENRVAVYDLFEILLSAISDVRPAANEKSIFIEQIIPSKPIRASVNQKHVFEIFRRILDNAIKFSSQNTTIQCLVDETDLEWIITIKDHGRGIPSSELPNITEKFYQINRKRFEQQGMGLGLFIAHRLAEINGGLLEFQSMEGIGTTAMVKFLRLQV